MLSELRIRALGVIDDTTVELTSGLTVVTGETGAGKTMVVTGLQLLFGGRGDAARVRRDAPRASVEGRLRLSPGPALERAVDAGAVIDDDGTLLVARTVGADGRSRAHLGGRAVPVGVLAELAADVLAVHGQSDQARLLRPAAQRAALDRFGGAALARRLDGYRTAWTAWQEAENAWRERTSRARELAQEADLLHVGLERIAAVDPQPGEDRTLDAELARLQHADTLRQAAQDAHDALSAEDGPDAAGLLGAARRSLSGAAELDPELAALESRVAEVGYLAADVATDLSTYAAQVEADPARLQAGLDRRAALADLVRRYGASVDQVLAWAATAAGRLAALDVSDEAVAQLVTRRDDTRDTAARAAAALRRERERAATSFAAAVGEELAGLAMPTAVVEVVVGPRPVVAEAPVLTVAAVACGAGPEGTDDVELRLRSGPGAPSLPLQRGASGGELSRVMLAVEVVFAAADPVPVMVFDEVDAGVGGRAAIEIGRRLARLAADRQVFVVTHLPQVAAYADTHLVVRPGVVDGAAVSQVQALDPTARVGELARMLAGHEGSEHAVRHAAELLEAAATERATRPGGPRGGPDRPAWRISPTGTSVGQSGP